jgi:DNA repair exonuclease SbcCD ATPase subunit
MTDFQHKVVLTLLDKGVLAFAALLVGYWISKRLEQYRTNQQRVAALENDKAALENEIEKLKRTRQMEFKEQQLSQFYWPVHFRLAKDTAIWKIVPHLSGQKSTLPEAIGREIEVEQVIRNHKEVVAIIENNIHFAQPNDEFLEQIAAYVRHVAVYSALRTAGIYDINPIDVGEPFPDGLIRSLEIRLTRLQDEYDDLTRP